MRGRDHVFVKIPRNAFIGQASHLKSVLNFSSSLCLCHITPALNPLPVFRASYLTLVGHCLKELLALLEAGDVSGEGPTAARSAAAPEEGSKVAALCQELAQHLAFDCIIVRRPRASYGSRHW